MQIVLLYRVILDDGPARGRSPWLHHRM